MALPDKPSKYFSGRKYGSMANAQVAARVHRDHYTETGEELVPRPEVLTKREMAAEFGVSRYRMEELLARYDPDELARMNVAERAALVSGGTL